MKDNLLNCIDEVISIIESSNEYQKYQTISKKMKNNSEIMNLISSVKALQQRLVKEQSLGKDISEIDEEINKKLKQLEEYPIYLGYTYLQEDLNSNIVLVKEKIENYINNLTN